jgi:hypothetical protein
VGAGSSFYGLAELTSLHPRWHGVKVSRRRLVRVRRELVTYLDAMAHARRRDRLEVTPMARKEYWTDDFPSGRLVAMGPGGHHVLSYRDLRRVLLWTDGPSQHALTVGFQTPFDDLDAMWSAYVRVLAELDIRSWRPFACDASFARSVTPRRLRQRGTVLGRLNRDPRSTWSVSGPTDPRPRSARSSSRRETERGPGPP